jgi:hypothetical protein
MPSADAIMAFRELEKFLEESAKTIQNPSMFAMQSPPGDDCNWNAAYHGVGRKKSA